MHDTRPTRIFENGVYDYWSAADILHNLNAIEIAPCHIQKHSSEEDARACADGLGKSDIVHVKCVPAKSRTAMKVRLP